MNRHISSTCPTYHNPCIHTHTHSSSLVLPFIYISNIYCIYVLHANHWPHALSLVLSLTPPHLSHTYSILALTSRDVSLARSLSVCLCLVRALSHSSHTHTPLSRNLLLFWFCGWGIYPYFHSWRRTETVGNQGQQEANLLVVNLLTRPLSSVYHYLLLWVGGWVGGSVCAWVCECWWIGGWGGGCNGLRLFLRNTADNGHRHIFRALCSQIPTCKHTWIGLRKGSAVDRHKNKHWLSKFHGYTPPLLHIQEADPCFHMWPAFIQREINLQVANL